MRIVPSDGLYEASKQALRQLGAMNYAIVTEKLVLKEDRTVSPDCLRFIHPFPWRFFSE
jgi:hypothetical protein